MTDEQRIERILDLAAGDLLDAGTLAGIFTDVRREALAPVEALIGPEVVFPNWSVVRAPEVPT